MGNAYKQLAILLDRIPNGYPETESGVELKILEKLFSPDEASIGCRLTLEPQTADMIAPKIGWEERKTYSALIAMAKKGLIEIEKGEGGLAFKLMPFVIGFYERQSGKIDEEFARLFEAYYKESLHKIMEGEPPIGRALLIDKVIPVNTEIMPYERASYYIENAKSWGLSQCMCREQKRLVGKGCKHTTENCLSFSSKPQAFEKASKIRSITMEESLAILEQADEEGLVHVTSNMQQGVNFICNCCSCSCAFLRGVTEYGHLNAVGRSAFYAEVDEDRCAGCSICIDRCHFKALTLQDGVCRIDRARCHGCGLCVSVCPSQGISLKHKPEEEIKPPALNETEWREKRVKGRV